MENQIKKQIDQLAQEVISDFQAWVRKTKSELAWVDGKLLLWVEYENIPSFGEMAGVQDDSYLPCTLINADYICVNCADFLSGYGFKMEDVLPKRYNLVPGDPFPFFP